jgi:hypothetical protein
VAGVALETSLSVEEADRMLSALAAKGHLEAAPSTAGCSTPSRSTMLPYKEWFRLSRRRPSGAHASSVGEGAFSEVHIAPVQHL